MPDTHAMRGLNVFIADIRNCRARALEEKRINKELANIRGKFKDPTLSGYNRRKYICKLLYIYILGWEIDFGYAEMLQLIASPRFSEQQIGYLAVTLMPPTNPEALDIVIRLLIEHLDSHNEMTQSLALHAIANMDRVEIARVTHRRVWQLVGQPRGSPFVRKKAALCMLRIYRTHHELIQPTECVVPLVQLMGHEDLGLTLAATTLTLGFAQQNPAAYQCAARVAVDRLEHLVNDRSTPAEFCYYNVPSPWLQIKLLKLLQYLPITTPASDRDATTRQLMGVLDAIMAHALEKQKTVQQNNVQRAIVFEAINLAIQLDPSSALVGRAAELVGQLLASRETNIRYLSLEAMTHLVAFIPDLAWLQQHQATITDALKDRDVSVRRRAVDLLYSMCDHGNVRAIVTELTSHLAGADYAMRDEMVIRIAILLDKFTDDLQWYVDMIIHLTSAVGDHVDDEVWHRLIQVVMASSDSIKARATQAAYDALLVPIWHEKTLLLAAVFLGEYGHLIVEAVAPVRQFAALHAKFSVASLATRASLLTTYLKLANLFPEIKPEIRHVFKHCSFVLDAELQQRACEYLAILDQPSDTLLQVACEELPPYPERESAVIGKLHARFKDTGDDRVWMIGGRHANLGAHPKSRASSPSAAASTAAAAAVMATNDSVDLLGSSPNSPSRHVTVAPLVQASSASSAQEAPSHLRTYRSLLARDSGVLYEDASVQIGLKMQVGTDDASVADAATDLTLALYVGNKGADAALTEVQVELAPAAATDALSLQCIQNFPDTVAPRAQVQARWRVRARAAFHGYLDPDRAASAAAAGTLPTPPPVTPVWTLLWTDAGGARATHRFWAPVSVGRFMAPIALDATAFAARWAQLTPGADETGALAREQAGSVDTARVRIPPEQRADPTAAWPAKEEYVARVGVLLQTYVRLSLVADAAQPLRVAAAGIFTAETTGKVGCLVQIHLAEHTRIVVRTTQATVSQALLHWIMETLQGPF